VRVNRSIFLFKVFILFFSFFLKKESLLTAVETEAIALWRKVVHHADAKQDHRIRRG